MVQPLCSLPRGLVMNRIEILLQGEGIAEIEVLRLETGAAVREVLRCPAIRLPRLSEGELLVFAEDDDESLHLDRPLPEPESGNPLRLHIHRCRHVSVTVVFNGECETHRF